MILCIIENSKIINLSEHRGNSMLDYYWFNRKVPPKLRLYNLKTVPYEFIEKRAKAISAFEHNSCSDLRDPDY